MKTILDFGFWMEEGKRGREAATGLTDATKSRVAGAILLELLLSMTLFLIVLLPLTRFLIQVAGTDRATDITLAAAIARSNLETLRLSPETPPGPIIVEQDGRTFRSVAQVQPHQGRYRLHVAVYRGADARPLVELTMIVYPEKTR